MKIDTTQAWTAETLIQALQSIPADTVLGFVRPGKAQNTCWCGCGGGTANKFVPGHDSKFHSLAKQVARGLAEMPTEFVSDEARADFLKWHDKDLANPPAKAVRAVARPADVIRPVAVVQSFEQTEELDSENLDEDTADLLREVTGGEWS
jgi:hypothetical protein